MPAPEHAVAHQFAPAATRLPQDGQAILNVGGLWARESGEWDECQKDYIRPGRVAPGRLIPTRDWDGRE
jgi:hypothetical protein